MGKKKKKTIEKQPIYYSVKLNGYDRNKEIRKILSGYYDNWKSFGYSGGTCSGK